LANRLRADAWFCLPHKADDEYVRNFAKVVKAKLNPDRKVYIEYSNEVWNAQFAQNKYAAEQGAKQKLDDAAWSNAWRYTAVRSKEIFRIFDAEFGATARARLVRVLPTQAANAWVSERIVETKDVYKEADALAVAPYVGFNVGPDSKPNMATVENWTPEQVLDHLENAVMPEVEKWHKEQKAVADKYNLKLIAYEGGQHLVGIAGGENNDKLTKLLHAANRHPRMGKLHDRYFAAWDSSGGDLFCYFASVGNWSKWGSWGVYEWVDENPADSPKYQALVRWAKSHGQTVGAKAVPVRVTSQ
jgi:hypothetical protein